MTLSCLDASALVPSYLDGELSEAQAGPLRAHLLDCPGCREHAKHESALKRWFQAAQESRARVPHGFAARVARRAFSGDRGLAAVPPVTSEESRLLPFVLVLSAVAAAALLVLSIALQSGERPAGEGLEADERAPWLVEREDAPRPAEVEPARPVR
jgi:anti-sigma factor RsiW